MKRILFNITFTTVFLLIFSTLISVNFDTMANAFTSHDPAFPSDKSLSINKCQQWTQQVRDFHVKDGEEANQMTVLMYHKIINDEDIDDDVHYDDRDSLYSTIVLKSEFEKQMKLLKEHDYITLTGKEFKLFMEGKLKIPKNSILITFDDGFRNNYYEAYDILKKNHFTALDFVITSDITEKKGKYTGKGQNYFSVEGIKKSCDVFDFQSHTYNFHQKTEDGTAYLVDKNKDEIKKDIQKSLVNLNKEDPIFAYPYGAYDTETIEAMKELNIGMAFTVEYNDARPGMNLYEIPRKAVSPSDTIEDFKAKINMR